MNTVHLLHGCGPAIGSAHALPMRMMNEKGARTMMTQQVIAASVLLLGTLGYAQTPNNPVRPAVTAAASATSAAKAGVSNPVESATTNATTHANADAFTMGPLQRLHAVVGA